jgi:hypothetical protein
MRYGETLYDARRRKADNTHSGVDSFAACLFPKDLYYAPEAAGVDRIALASGAEYIDVSETLGNGSTDFFTKDILDEVLFLVPWNLTAHQNALMVSGHGR